MREVVGGVECREVQRKENGEGMEGGRKGKKVFVLSWVVSL